MYIYLHVIKTARGLRTFKVLFIRRWRLERFEEDEIRYQNAEVHRFSENVKSKLEGGMKGHDLVNEILMEWENRVAKSEVVDKMIVCGRDCGRAARWWDNEGKIHLRRELYKNGREDLWDEYCR